ncbi:hypothetical protein CHRY9390_01514 [Chryseobacterium aquaeductus]|uniref:Phosphoribosylpyrophosphate synthetase n=1 Tax=Chryseobacterium aquaeductus TaxID=2675056 RepID=A0A9N8MFI1_9FLAO|nr:hypothetical protein [Chryseobacterium aquaeductus]CAA7330841.1 hypothetical protein CHRY9390_01514 [Chryseobacterium potabilaquae]CAD7806460.1 hypothetical protein CHRY9390_01514 [Chryseobacterium aquaeductus]
MDNQENIDQMSTLSQVMNTMAKRGITREYRMNDACEMRYEDSERNYKPEDLTILKSYRFEGDSNPDDNAVLYILTDTEGNIGMIIDSYGADSNYPGEEFDAFLRDIPINESDEY